MQPSSNSYQWMFYHAKNTCYSNKGDHILARNSPFDYVLVLTNLLRLTCDNRKESKAQEGGNEALHLGAKVLRQLK